jgi:hypothetical protein
MWGGQPPHPLDHGPLGFLPRKLSTPRTAPMRHSPLSPGYRRPSAGQEGAFSLASPAAQRGGAGFGFAAGGAPTG